MPVFGECRLTEQCGLGHVKDWCLLQDCHQRPPRSRQLHLFQQADTGSPNEYATLPKEFAPGFLDLVTGWITEHAQAGG